MKDGLFWTLRRPLYNMSNSYELMEVTTAEGSRYWGRAENGDATNARAADTKGKFPTAEAARGMIDTLRKIDGGYRGKIDILRRDIRDLENKRDAEIEDAIRAALKALPA